MKNTALTHKHEALGAKMVEFAGFNMPVQYSGVTDEHHAVRQQAGLFDVSHMGEFFLKGPKAKDLIQKVSSNDADKLHSGKAQYSCMPNGQGGIVDDLLIYQLDDEEYMLVVNAANIEKDKHWILQHNEDIGAEFEDVSDRTALLAIQGPAAMDILQELTATDLASLKFYTFTKGTVAGVEDVLISQTGYTGEHGFELYFPAEHAEKVWDALMETGEPQGLKPAGLAARDTLRLEMGLCLYGNDIDDTTSPIEAKLGWITKFTKDFVDRATLEKQKKEGVSRKLVAFRLLDKGIPRKGYVIEDEEGQAIGEVTSGTMSPTLGEPIGMGYVAIGHKDPGNKIYIAIRKKKVPAEVVKTPFISKN